MKSASTIHNLAALAIFLVWVALIGAMIVNREFWAGALPYVLSVSFATMVGTVLLSRYWIRHKRAPSYGSIFMFPSLCVFLLFWGALFWDACRNGEWDVFSWSYWEQSKGGFAGLIIPIATFWFVSLFPATAIVIYFQKPHDST
ncbi:MAG TPA: hypothetical protein VGI03_15205 [Verrucomicrobiae bacterium]|jgi:hypothetical protein